MVYAQGLDIEGTGPYSVQQAYSKYIMVHTPRRGEFLAVSEGSHFRGAEVDAWKKDELQAQMKLSSLLRSESANSRDR